MSTKGLFDETGDTPEIQTSLGLDDASGLRVVSAGFLDEQKFDWEDVPSTLIDEEASGGSRTVLYRVSLEAFLGRRLRPLRRWWTPWK